MYWVPKLRMTYPTLQIVRKAGNSCVFDTFCKGFGTAASFSNLGWAKEPTLLLDTNNVGTIAQARSRWQKCRVSRLGVARIWRRLAMLSRRIENTSLRSIRTKGDLVSSWRARSARSRTKLEQISSRVPLIQKHGLGTSQNSHYPPLSPAMHVAVTTHIWITGDGFRQRTTDDDGRRMADDDE